MGQDIQSKIDEETLRELKEKLVLFGGVGDHIIFSYFSQKDAIQTAQELNAEVGYIRTIYVKIQNFIEEKKRAC